MSNQIIVAISREYGSGGHYIARKIAEALDYKFYDRNILDNIAKEKNIQIEYLEKYDEKPKNILLSRRVGAYSNSIAEILADMQFEYLRKKADSGESFVVVGRCAETILKDREGLIKIFILGDKTNKIQRTMENFNISKEEAIVKIKRHDFNRKAYHNRHSNFKWGDSRNYDLCVNSSKLGIEKTADMLITYIKNRIGLI